MLLHFLLHPVAENVKAVLFILASRQLSFLPHAKNQLYL